MTILYPSLLQPYEAPFGRMMLAYGRAIAATVALVTTNMRNEAEAVLFVSDAGSKELPKRMRHIFRPKLDREQFEQLNKAMTRLKALADKRHQLIHGELWFNVFENGQLTIRGVRSRRAKSKKVSMTIRHLDAVSVHDLDQWANELNEIADALDIIEHRFRNP